MKTQAKIKPNDKARNLHTRTPFKPTGFKVSHKLSLVPLHPIAALTRLARL
jgi:hypothetical protein